MYTPHESDTFLPTHYFFCSTRISSFCTMLLFSSVYYVQHHLDTLSEREREWMDRSRKSKHVPSRTTTSTTTAITQQKYSPISFILIFAHTWYGILNIDTLKSYQISLLSFVLLCGAFFMPMCWFSRVYACKAFFFFAHLSLSGFLYFFLLTRLTKHTHTHKQALARTHDVSSRGFASSLWLKIMLLKWFKTPAFYPLNWFKNKSNNGTQHVKVNVRMDTYAIKNINNHHHCSLFS